MLLDVDGTLAPIVRHAEDATSRADARLLIAVAKRYGVVACVAAAARPTRGASSRSARSPTSATTAPSCCAAGATEPESTARCEEWAARVQEFAARGVERELRRLRVRVEDKDVDRRLPLARRARRGRRARRPCASSPPRRGGRAGHALGRARCSRCARRCGWTRAAESGACCASADVGAALYAGDDATDLDAFAALREMVGRRARCSRGLVGVALRRDARRGRARGRRARRRAGRRPRAARGAGGVAAACGSPTSSRRRCCSAPAPRRARRRHRRRRARTATRRSSSSRSAGGWSRRSSALCSAAAPRSTPPIAPAAGRRQRGRRLPEHRPGRILLNRLWPLLVLTVAAGGARLPLPADPGDRDRLRDHLGAGVAAPGAGRAAIEERDGVTLLRRADLAGRADPARAHAGLAARGARRSRRVDAAS